MKTALVGVAAALVGALAALATVAVSGNLGGGGRETIVVPVRDDAAPAAAADVPPPLTGNGFNPARIYAARAPGVVTVVAIGDNHASTGAAAQGSGFVTSAEGVVLTNAHVVTTDDDGELRPLGNVYVEFADGARVRARLVGWDAFVDVAVLRVDPDAHPLEPLPLGDSDTVVVGEPVAAIGSPFGNPGSISVGVVAATRRSIASLTSRYSVVDAIQTDAPINRGNSGGPLLDARGRVIGINAQIRSSSGTAEGVGFAIPINAARRSLSQLLRNGRVAYAYVGVQADDLTPDVAERIDVAASRGALIVGETRGPARRAGLRGGSNDVLVNGRRVAAGGDVVVAVNGEAVTSGDDLVRIVTNRLAPGELARFTVVRGSRRFVVPVRLGERPRLPGE